MGSVQSRCYPRATTEPASPSPNTNDDDYHYLSIVSIAVVNVNSCTVLIEAISSRFSLVGLTLDSVDDTTDSMDPINSYSSRVNYYCPLLFRKWYYVSNY